MNPIALASQAVRELSPADAVRAAARAGFDMVGLWVEPGVWTRATTRAVRAALAESGLSAIDAEVIRIHRGVEPDHLRLIDIAAEVGAAHVIAVGQGPDHGRIAEALAALAGHARPGGVRVVLEFGPFSAVPRLADALAILSGAPGVGLLPDPIHLDRSGEAPADLLSVPPGLIGYAQICDAGPRPVSGDRADFLGEARFHRRNLGEGVLPLRDYVASLPPGIPLSNETRSLAIEMAWPDPYARAEMLARTMRALLG